MENDAIVMADLPPPPKHFLPKELANRWRVNIRRIKKLRQEKRLPAVQFGPRDFRFPVEEILKLEERGEFFQHIDSPSPQPAVKPRRTRSKTK
jgi:hypothetical protein